MKPSEFMTNDLLVLAPTAFCVDIAGNKLGAGGVFIFQRWFRVSWAIVYDTKGRLCYIHSDDIEERIAHEDNQRQSEPRSRSDVP